MSTALSSIDYTGLINSLNDSTVTADFSTLISALEASASSVEGTDVAIAVSHTSLRLRASHELSSPPSRLTAVSPTTLYVRNSSEVRWRRREPDFYAGILVELLVVGSSTTNRCNY